MTVDRAAPGGSGELDWGIKASLLAYVDALADGRIETTGGAARLPSGAVRFPFVGLEPIEGGSRARFRGGVRLAGHGGLMAVDLSDPWLEVRAERAVLSFVNVEAGEAPRRLDIATASSSLTQRERSRWTPVRLTMEGAFVLGALQYSAGQPVDDLAVRVPADRGPGRANERLPG